MNKILVIEDSSTIRKALTDAIENKTFFDVVFAETYAEAKKILDTTNNKDWFVAVVDLNLPDASHGEAVDLVLDQDIPVIVFTGTIDTNSIEYFNTKPILEYIMKNSITGIRNVVNLINNLDDNQKETILIVDDSATSRMMYEKLLQMHFFKTIQAGNGEEALSILKKHPNIKIILTDYHMPIMDGFELTSKIREKYTSYEKGILAITGDYHPLNIALFLKSGANDFIVKTCRKEEFYARLYQLKEGIRFHEELEESRKLLQDHKEAVDERSIVSKTDPNGVITYVNDRFVEISGYAREELLGKKHNIVRHPDMPSEVYADMWKTIKSKKTWNGIVKNKTKEGHAYIVDAVIKPLLDTKGNIKEYIGIRHDLTELVALQDEIIDTQKEIIERLGEVAESRSKETGKHIKRVAEYSALLGELCGLDSEEIALIRMASPMHDIGKIATPDLILLKPGKLNPDEYEIMKLHAQKGYDILKGSSRPILRTAAIIAYQHHEKWDGSGYPQGIAEKRIHIYGRIASLADVFDALACRRIYKEAWPMDKVIDYISSERGKSFDPNLVDLMLADIERFIAISEEFDE